MKIWKIMVDDVVLGGVVDQNGSLSPSEALAKWNASQPSYQGDTAEELRFITA